MENKKSFILYCDLLKTVEKLPKEKAGELFLHILKYVNDINPETEDLLLQIAFEPIKQQLKRDLIEWQLERNARSKAGKKGMKSRWNNKDNTVINAITEDNTVINAITNITDTVTVNVNDNEIKRKKFCDSIFDYFEIAENIQPLNIQKLHLFYSTLLKENKIELFLNQFKKYKKYRIDSKNKYRFSLDNFIKEAWFASSWETKINLTASEMCIDNLPAKYRDLIGLSFNTLKIRQFDDPEKEKWSRWMYKEREKNGITKGNYYGIQ